MTFLLRRALTAVAQLAAASLLTFALFTLLPGDFYTAEVYNPQRSAQVVEALRDDAGLHRPWPARYGSWVASCARGEFGASLAYGMPVGSLLAPRAAATLSAALPAFVLAWLGGLVLAMAAQRSPGVVQEFFRTAAAAAAIVPDVLSVSLLLWLAVRLGAPIDGAPLPVLGLTVSLLPVVFLHAFASISAARHPLFVELARQRGITGMRLLFRFILPAAANPLISLFGLSLATTIGSSLLVEAITGWPGIGPLFLEAVQARDYPIVQSVLLILSAILIVANFVADLLLYRLDPRIRVSA